MSYCRLHQSAMDGGRTDNCPLCALEKRMKVLEEWYEANTPSQPFIPHPSTVSASPLEPKLYSGFTTDEWKLMLKGGPLLCEVEGEKVWIDRFDDKCLGRPVIGNTEHWFNEVKLLEQPNWRPHMTDECPVPGRVRVEIRFIPYRTISDDSACHTTIVADSMDWEKIGSRGDIYAYRILGM